MPLIKDAEYGLIVNLKIVKFESPFFKGIKGFNVITKSIYKYVLNNLTLIDLPIEVLRLSAFIDLNLYSSISGVKSWPAALSLWYLLEAYLILQ